MFRYVSSQIRGLIKVNMMPFIWPFKKQPKQAIKSEPKQIDTSYFGNRILERKTREFLKYYEKDPSIIDSMKDRDDFLCILQNVSQYQTLPDKLMREVEIRLINKVSGMPAEQLTVSIVLFILTSRQIPNPFLYVLSTKIS